MPPKETYMPRKASNLYDVTWRLPALLVLALTSWPGSQAVAADEPDLIFKRSTVFKWLSPNDKLATYGLDDPEVEGVACHFTVPEKGGFKGWIGWPKRCPTSRLRAVRRARCASRASSSRAMTCSRSGARCSSRR